jgi:hypothetical protein
MLGLITMSTVLSPLVRQPLKCGQLLAVACSSLFGGDALQ